MLFPLTKLHRTKSMTTKRFYWRIALAFFFGGIVILVGVHVYIFIHTYYADTAQDHGASTPRQTFTEDEIQTALEKYMQTDMPEA